MAIAVYANGEGDGVGTHVSVYAPLVQGKFDSQLNWPLVGSVTFTLLNQLQDKNHYRKIVLLTKEHGAVVGKSGWGFWKFIPHSELGHDPVKNMQYLKDDTLYMRVEVKVDEHKPWLDCTINM